MHFPSVCRRYALIHGEHASDRFAFVNFDDTRIQPRFNTPPSQFILTVVDREGQPLLVRMR